MLEFFKQFWSKCDESAKSESKEILPVGKIMAINVKIFEKSANSMMDSGAQISLIQANFVKDLFESCKSESENVKIFRKTRNVVDINGKVVECYGIIILPVIRKGCEAVEIPLHITDAPIGLPILFGTNALGPLGFKIFDTQNGELLEFECANDKFDSVRVIYSTLLGPGTTKFVELSIPNELSGKDIIITTKDQDNVVRVESSLVKGRDGKVITAVMNLSQMAIKLEENDEIAIAEEITEVADTEDCLGESWFFKSPSEIKEKIKEVVVERSKAEIGPLDQNNLEILKQLLNDFQQIFAVDDKDLTQTEMVKHRIDTGEAYPVKQRMRPVPYAYREKVAVMIQDYLGRGIIRHSISPWASPIVIVPKKDGSLRFCVDYRGLNAITRKDCFPLPNIERTLLMLGGRKFFSTLDFLSGYWQIKMDEHSIEKTAFATEFGLHEFTVMPFGLFNAVATFQRFMSHLFGNKLNDFLFVYIDDVLVASESFEQHLEHLNFVFEQIKDAGLRLKIFKCHFCTKELKFLGHILTRNGIKMDDDKIKPILEMPIPKSKKELHSFLGFMTYYRKFIYSFGPIAAPLFKLLKKDAPFKMGEVETETISKLKEKILLEVVLYFPDFKAAMENASRKFIIMTDACKTGISAVLCQPDTESRIRPIYFASRQCNNFESKYCPTELEALAVRFGVKKFAQYIIMIPTKVLTDHKALVPMFKSKNETGNSRVDKWIMELNSRFLLEIEYNPGKANIIADVLSRSGVFKPQESVVVKNVIIGEANKRVANVTVQEKEVDEWITATKDSELQHIYIFLEKRKLPEDSRELQRILDTIQKFTLINGLLYFYESSSANLRLFVPQKFRKQLIDERHEGKCAGHLSGKKIFGQLAEKYFWPNMRADCVNSDKSREKMERWFNSQPKVTPNKYQKGQRVMIIFPGANQRSTHKKLKWNIFGPYEILEISKSSAKVVPIDKKNSDPISVPLERLIRAPDGLPNISTVPRGKNIYKNLLNVMTIIIFEEGQMKNSNYEKLSENIIKSSGTMNFSGQGEKMDVGSELEAPIKWEKCCDGTGEHILCKKLFAADLDPVLDLQGDLGSMAVTTPLQGLITIFILRSNISMSASKELLKVLLNWRTVDGIDKLQAILLSDPDFELLKFVECRGDAIRSNCFPKEDEVDLIWNKWTNSCTLIHDELRKSGFGPIKLDAPFALSEMPQADQIGWKKVFDYGSWAVEKARAHVVFGKTMLIDQPRVIIGDSSAAQLCGEAPNQIAAHFIGTINGGLGDVIRALNKTILTSKVISALIIVGRDALMRGETIEQISEECTRIKTICAQFKNVRFIWIPPPFVREQHAQYNQLLPALENVAAEWFVAMTMNGRSLVEIWRFGDSFDMARVKADGRMLPEGLKCLRAWIFTQISEFPDDQSLGIRRPSRSIPSVPHQLSELSINRSHNSRVHPYAIRHSNYNSRGHRDGKFYDNRRHH